MHNYTSVKEQVRRVKRQVWIRSWLDLGLVLDFSGHVSADTPALSPLTGFKSNFPNHLTMGGEA